MAILFVTASLALGCASLGGGPSQSRADAISACLEAVPAETVPYADAFASCMEARGWVYRAVSATRD
ncbi:MAG: hypothetical protein VCC20_14365 [Myxococcota bacterium]